MGELLHPLLSAYRRNVIRLHSYFITVAFSVDDVQYLGFSQPQEQTLHDIPTQFISSKHLNKLLHRRFCIPMGITLLGLFNGFPFAHSNSKQPWSREIMILVMTFVEGLSHLFDVHQQYTVFSFLCLYSVCFSSRVFFVLYLHTQALLMLRFVCFKCVSAMWIFSVLSKKVAIIASLLRGENLRGMSSFCLTRDNISFKEEIHTTPGSKFQGRYVTQKFYSVITNSFE